MQLVPGSLRRPTMALLAACVAAMAMTGIRFAGYGLPAPPARRCGADGDGLRPVVTADLLPVGVASAMVANGAHSFTDAVAGAAVGTGVVLACALTLDALGSRPRSGPAAPPPPAG